MLLLSSRDQGTKMADSTDDYRYGEEYSLAPLIDDCKLLGSLLDDALKTEVGEELFGKVRLNNAPFEPGACQQSSAGA